MGWSFRRSMSVAKLFRVNLSSRGIGASFGIPGFRVGLGSDGRVRRTLSVPGTGIRNTAVVGGAHSSRPVTAFPVCGGGVAKSDEFCSSCGQHL